MALSVVTSVATSSTSVSQTITLPGTPQAGDRYVLVAMGYLNSASGANAKVSIWSRAWQSGDGTSVTINTSSRAQTSGPTFTKHAEEELYPGEGGTNKGGFLAAYLIRSGLGGSVSFVSTSTATKTGASSASQDLLSGLSNAAIGDLRIGGHANDDKTTAYSEFTVGSGNIMTIDHQESPGSGSPSNWTSYGVAHIVMPTTSSGMWVSHDDTGAEYGMIGGNFREVAGGTTTPKAVSVGMTLTPTVSTVRDYVRTITQGLTLTPTISRLASLSHAVSSSLTLSPVVSRLQTLSRSISWGLNLTPSVSPITSRFRSIATGLTLTGTVTRTKIFFQNVSTGMTLTGAVAKHVGKNISVGMTATPTVNDVKSLSRAISVGLGTVFNIAVAVTKAIVAGITLTPNVTTATDRFRSITAGLTLTGSVGTVFTPGGGNTTPQPVSVGLTLSPSVSLLKSFGRSVPVTLTLSPTVGRAISKNISTGLALSPALTEQRALLWSVSSGLVLSPTAARAMTKQVSTGLVLAGSVTDILDTTEAVSSGLTLGASVSTNFIPEGSGGGGGRGLLRVAGPGEELRSGAA